MHRLTFTFIYLFIKLIILVHKKLKLMINKEIDVAHFGLEIVELSLT